MTVVNRFAQQNAIVPEHLRYGTHQRAMQARGFIDDSGVADLWWCGALLVQPGFFQFEECVAILGALPGVTPQDAHDATWARWSSFNRWQRRFDTPGDWTRLEAASATLADRNILVRHNFTCCRTCADDEISDDRGRRPGRPPEWAYVFSSQIDAYDLAAPEASLWLSYGIFGPAPSITDEELAQAQHNDQLRDQQIERSFTELATSIVDALREQDLTVEWNADTNTRIRVTAWTGADQSAHHRTKGGLSGRQRRPPNALMDPNQRAAI